MRITFHHDWWGEHVVERQPRVRFGQVHLFNNLWSSSGNNCCIGVGVGANILTENNAFVGVKTPMNTTSYVDASIASSTLKSSGNIYSNTTGDKPVDLNAGAVLLAPVFVLRCAESRLRVQGEIESGAGPG